MRESPARRRPAGTRGGARDRALAPGRHAAHHQREVRRGRQVARSRPDRRRPGQRPLRDRAEGPAASTRSCCAGARRGLVAARRWTTARCASRTPTTWWGCPPRRPSGACGSASAPAIASSASDPRASTCVRYATISGDGRHAGRGGLGAVLGAKRLKGIAVRGTQTHAAGRPATASLALARDLSRALARATGPRSTASSAPSPTCWSSTGWARCPRATSRPAASRAPRRSSARRSTPTAGARAQALRRVHDRLRARLPDAGRARACGSSTRALRARARSAASTTARRSSRRRRAATTLGLDVISAGRHVGLRHGVPRARPPRRRARPSATARACSPCSRTSRARRGRGDLLAEGSRRAAERIGRGAARFACHVKGLELPGYEPRALQAMALGPRRGHARRRPQSLRAPTRTTSVPARTACEADRREGRGGRRAPRTARRCSTASILCKFLRGVFDDLDAECAAMLSAVTGWDVDGERAAARPAERVVTAAQALQRPRGLDARGGHAAGALPRGAADGRPRRGGHVEPQRTRPYDRRLLSRPGAGRRRETCPSSAVSRLDLRRPRLEPDE